MRSGSGGFCCRLRAYSPSFRARFIGKVSPIHLFWGAMDLACTRFSGRTAPTHPSMPGLPDRVTRDAYSHEVSSCGFWPGSPGIEALFYSYAYPEPPGYRDYSIAPAAGSFDTSFGEFVLPYEAMRALRRPRCHAAPVPAKHLRGRRRIARTGIDRRSKCHRPSPGDGSRLASAGALTVASAGPMAVRDKYRTGGVQQKDAVASHQALDLSAG